jgi:ABC-2 type transport system ATP-binding protein
MAVLAEGRVLLEGAPRELICASRGRIWTKAVERRELDTLRERHEVLSTRLFSGRTVIHVLADSDPGEGFASAEAGLEDVYFASLAEARRAA